MKLVTFGDSWVWGDELGDNSNQYRNTHNIGGLVNKDYTFSDYINYAQPGMSNTYIMTQILHYLNSDRYDKDDFLMIGLTSPNRRMEYNNIEKKPFTYTGWDRSVHLHFTQDDDYRNDKEYKMWWKGNVKYGMNNRNDFLDYVKICFSIKGLLETHSKYLVWHSMDSKFMEETINDDYEEIESKYEFKQEDWGEPNLSVFNTRILDKNLNTNPKQKWINFSEPVWLTYLQENFDMNEVGAPSSAHPNELGNLIWYNDILKKYIKEIL